MGRRTVYGNDWSSNGWPMVDQDSCTWVTVPGTDVSLQIQNGQPLQILRAFAADFNAEVEPLRDPDSACWTAGNSVSDSNHLSGTAMDLNWDSHPFRIADAGFDAAKKAKVRELLNWYEGTVFWGNDWTDPKDAMHFQLASLANGGNINTYGNPFVDDFIKRKIRPDGFSTRRSGAQSADATNVLSRAMGTRLSLDRYRQLLPAVAASLSACECSTVDRIAMWCAQIGHESGGLYYTEEIASGAAYEGRADLGNTQPGDGVRFKGRSWIQITGRSNYTQLSKWANSKGLVPSATYFVDNPAALASDEYAGLGAAWYWVVARPDINALADRGDLETVTRRINGGTNGLADRRDRYNRALALGEQLLTLVGGNNVTSPLHASQSIYATPGEGAIWTTEQLIRNIDGMVHALYVEASARLGDFDSLSRVARLYYDKNADQRLRDRANNLIADIERDNPDMLATYFASQAFADLKNGVAQ